MWKVLFLGLLTLSLNAQAGIGKLVVKSCRGANICKKMPQPSNTTCAVSVTTLSRGRIGDSDFKGLYSIPALGVSDKTFYSSIMEYSPNDESAGILRSSKSGSQLGEWTGFRQDMSNGMLKIKIKNFYVYVKKAGDAYLEYQCRL